MKTSLKSAISIALLGVSALTASNVLASDRELLDTLYQNGVLNKAQYEKLISQEEEKEVANITASSGSLKAMEWASRIKISGDLRVRQEFKDQEAVGKGVKDSRQRIRARIAIGAKINDEVDAGVRIVTGGGTTSTNQSLGNFSSGKALYIDRAFIDWHPDFADGLNMIVGKFKQPWYSVSDIVWDTDVNPEGLALKYSRKLGSVKLTGTMGYFLFADGITSTGNDSFSDDLNMYHAGLSGEMKFNKMIKASLGYNAYIFNNARNDFDGTNDTRIVIDKDGKSSEVFINAFDTANGKATSNGHSSFHLHEIAGKIDINTGLLPIKLYANYVFNVGDVRNRDGIEDDQDSAWLAGIATKYGPFKLDYNYRDTQRDGVVAFLHDADFNGGATAARGHKIKLGYKVSKNFSLGLAYLAATNYEKEDYDTFQIDLKAKF